MGLKTTDFLLTSVELAEINRYVGDMADAHAKAGEDPPDGVRVVFEFTPIFGREVTVYFNGAVNGYPITDSLAENHESKP